VLHVHVILYDILFCMTFLYFYCIFGGQFGWAYLRLHFTLIFDKQLTERNWTMSLTHSLLRLTSEGRSDPHNERSCADDHSESIVHPWSSSTCCIQVFLVNMSFTGSVPMFSLTLANKVRSFFFTWHKHVYCSLFFLFLCLWCRLPV